MLVVGQGGVGKTSLVKRLLGQDIDAHEETTRPKNPVRWQIDLFLRWPFWQLSVCTGWLAGGARSAALIKEVLSRLRLIGGRKST